MTKSIPAVCHPERSDDTVMEIKQMLHFVQHDRLLFVILNKVKDLFLKQKQIFAIAQDDKLRSVRFDYTDKSDTRKGYPRTKLPHPLTPSRKGRGD